MTTAHLRPSRPGAGQVIGLLATPSMMCSCCAAPVASALRRSAGLTAGVVAAGGLLAAGLLPALTALQAWHAAPMTVLRSIVLFAVAAVAEIGGAWLVWQGVRGSRGLLWTLCGVLALGAYGFVATLQPSAEFGRVLAAYGGVFVAGSLAWAVALDGYRPDRFDVLGAATCLLGVAVIAYAPRGA